MNNPFRFFATGKDKPLLESQHEVDTLYKRYRLTIMLAITVGYGFAYTCRLALSVVKKPLIDGGLLTAEQLGMIGSALFYGYAFGKFTNGFLADHANLKKFFCYRFDILGINKHSHGVVDASLGLDNYVGF